MPAIKIPIEKGGGGCDCTIENIDGLQQALDSKQAKATINDNGTSLSYDFTTDKIQLTARNSSGTLSATGLAEGEIGYARVENTHATNTITITNPTASSWILEIATVDIPAGYYRDLQVFYDGTNYTLSYGTLKVKNAD